MIKEIGETVRYLRERQGFSQEKLAVLSGCTRATIVKIENGTTNPGLKALSAISKALNRELKVQFLQQITEDSLEDIGFQKDPRKGSIEEFYFIENPQIKVFIINKNNEDKFTVACLKIPKWEQANVNWVSDILSRLDLAGVRRWQKKFIQKN